MAYKYTHFIPQNIAPKGAKKIVVYDGNGTTVCTIPLGRMAQPSKPKLYSFGLVSDIHLWTSDLEWKGNTKFDNALTYFENYGCEFCCISGDLTQTGLYKRTVENDASTTYLDEGQLKKYQEICGNHPNLPVYEIAGNHESYYSMPITNNLTKWGTYTGQNVLHYTVEYQNDVFIFCGQPRGSDGMTDEAFTFLSNALSANSNKRCFVFVHPIWNDDSGDVNGLYATTGGGGATLSSWSKGTDLKNLLKDYPKVVLFHGHTHIKFEEQVKEKNLNYTNKNGFHSVHIPSLSRPRDIEDSKLVYAPSESQGYIVDVYDDCIVLNGMAFNYTDTTAVPVPLGTFKIYTT